MYNKLLKSYTIIPDHLYVRRDADRLIEFIINDTGRPGYVLVARQMGKTNLLLNAKSTLIGKDDACVYVDFSNSFRSARECFRYIIDLAIETNPEKLHFIHNKIKKARQESDEVDHVEHLTELRSLLQVIKGKLIILIDEVDAMTTVSFSDIIFKQIRSIYFSRTNFPVLHKLNYILSGVGEPSKLIKDPKISPFNIGQEIFLGDFSYSEYQEFLRKANMNLDNEVAERIYYWTNGNPRMTYEICSAVEDILLIDSAIDVEVIDKLVGIMYLTTFDRVPLDNIRSMVQADSEMAKSVKRLKNKELSLITADQRRQLYLSGIAGANFEGDKLSIKNRIIDKALSNEWLSEVDEDEDLIELVSSASAKGDFDTVIKLLEGSIDKYANDSAFVLLQKSIITSYFNIKKYANLVDHFEKRGTEVSDNISLNSLLLKCESFFLYASALVELNRYDEALIIFRKIVSLKSLSLPYFNSLLGMAHLISSPGFLSDDNAARPQERAKLILDLYNTAAQDLESIDVKLSKDEYQDSKFSIYCNFGIYYKDHDEPQLAHDSFKIAFSQAPSSIQPFVLYNMAITSQSIQESNSLCIETVNSIVDNKVVLRDYFNGVVNYFGYVNAYGLILKCLSFSREYAFVLIKYFLSEELKMQAFQVEVDQSTDDIVLAQLIARDRMFMLAFKEFADSMTREQLRFSYKVFKDSKLIKVEDAKPIMDAILKFDFLPEVDSLDISYMSVIGFNSVKQGDLTYSQALIKYMREKYFTFKERPVSELILVEYFEMEIMRKQSKPLELFDRAKSILTTLKGFNSGKVDSAFLNKELMDYITDVAFRTYTELMPRYSTASEPKIAERSRRVTVKYIDGRTETDKFKRFEKDLLKGRCMIIESD
ncbi:AAA-like domain-containing protein [Hymenobacter sp. M29]|uniref:AAA-like domain-containing protein n=1 Tax=Hymenobacter mellowenesis TaxID=3063995 RepID=A0ABT9AI69_9BACT|nr:AAA-like domain-containing protein [Hymenobacter sp. M29]MDO7849569.1 AAA-like domain-containing protein [Hymenobacter sp. M29]